MKYLIKTLEKKQLKAERLAKEVYFNRPKASRETPSPEIPTRFYKLFSIAQKLNKCINKIYREEREKKVIPKKTIGELRAMVIEERRAIKEAGFTFPLRNI